MNYNDCINFINSKLKFGMKPGLDRIKKTLNQIGNPENSLKFVHVAGTNGKGSTCNMISSVLIESGYNVGLFTSPFIINFRDRIRINNKMITEDELCSLVERLMPFSSSLTEFEFITVIALQWFKEKQCDIVVLEVGLGGRFDATNVIETSLISVITSISFDHKDVLGNTLEQIAKEKCGIIKPGGITVSYPGQRSCVREVIKKESEKRKNRLVIPKFSDVNLIEYGVSGSRFEYKNKVIDLNLAGEHQIKNCILAVEVLEALNECGFLVSNLSIAGGIKKVNMPARIEFISYDPFIILDGSHNLDGIRALGRFIKDFLSEKKLIGVFGVLKDKDYKSMIKEISSYFRKVYTVPVKNKRSLSENELKKEVKKYCFDVHEKKSVEEAIYSSVNSLEKNEVIIVFGSLYLSSDARIYLKRIINI